MSITPTPSRYPPDLTGYRFLQRLGTGGNSQVYLYEQALPRRKVAVKVLNESGLTETARRRFTAEANVTAGLSHRHIVQVFEANVTPDGRPYLVMPYYPRPNLSVRARRAPFSVAEVLRIGIQIGSAVETSHRNNVLHRDIKPQNVLTDAYGEPALTDFGIATTKGGDGPEGLSVPWSPPEILYGTTAGDERSDVYSLGATLWHLLVGRSPFEEPGGDNSAFALMGRIKSDPPPRTGRADVPESLERLLGLAMAKLPTTRPQSALDLIRGLQTIEQELRLPITQPILPASERSPVGEPADDSWLFAVTLVRDSFNAAAGQHDKSTNASTGPADRTAARNSSQDGESDERSSSDQVIDQNSDDSGLLFRVYVPSSRLYAAEIEKFISLFRDWLGSVRSYGIRQDGYQTVAGKVYEFFLSDGSSEVDIPREYNGFAHFMTLCAADPSSAAVHLAQAGLSEAEASAFSGRYGREIRRLNLDLRQEREQRILAICHTVESDLVDSDVDPAAITASQIRSAVEALVPNPSANTARSMFELSGWSTAAPVNISINQQVINAVESTVVQNIKGQVNLGPQAEELIRLVHAYGGQDAVSLRTAVYELEDQDARPADRRKAKNRLKEFIRQLGKSAQDVAVDVLEKYIEAKLGM